MYHNVVGRAVLLEIESAERRRLRPDCRPGRRSCAATPTVCSTLPAGASPNTFRSCSAQLAGTSSNCTLMLLRACRWRIHQHHGPVEEAVLDGKLRSERASRVEVNVVFDHDAGPGGAHPPFAGLGLHHGNGLPDAALGAQVFDVGGKVAYLVKRVPDRHVETTSPLACVNRMLTCARWFALSASETKYSVGCGCALVGEVQVTGVRAAATAGEIRSDRGQRQRGNVEGLEKSLTRASKPRAAPSASRATSRRCRQSRRWRGSRPHRLRAVRARWCRRFHRLTRAIAPGFPGI